jgi:hypothetical protein
VQANWHIYMVTSPILAGRTGYPVCILCAECRRCQLAKQGRCVLKEVGSTVVDGQTRLEQAETVGNGSGRMDGRLIWGRGEGDLTQKAKMQNAQQKRHRQVGWLICLASPDSACSGLLPCPALLSYPVGGLWHETDAATMHSDNQDKSKGPIISHTETAGHATLCLPICASRA